MARDIERAREAIKGALGVPVLGQSPAPRAQVTLTLLADGSVNCSWSGDEIVTRFLFSKGLSIFESAMAAALKQREGA